MHHFADLCEHFLDYVDAPFPAEIELFFSNQAGNAKSALSRTAAAATPTEYTA
jgi:hypothetical protein